MTTAKPLFERHFAGPANKGLRARIRALVASHDETRTVSLGDRIRALGGTIALTCCGLAALDACAADYDAAARRA
jgi:hypothetical protein